MFEYFNAQIYSNTNTLQQGCKAKFLALQIKAVYSTNLLELSLADAVAVEDDFVGLEARGLVELDEQVLDHEGELLDDLLTVLLDTDRGRVTRRVRVHAADNLQR